MSRYEWIEGEKEISIGYDRPLRTFFAQVHKLNVPEDEDDIELWLGGSFGEFRNLSDLLQVFPHPVCRQLQDRLEADSRGDQRLIESIKIPADIKQTC